MPIVENFSVVYIITVKKRILFDPTYQYYNFNTFNNINTFMTALFLLLFNQYVNRSYAINDAVTFCNKSPLTQLYAMHFVGVPGNSFLNCIGV